MINPTPAAISPIVTSEPMKYGATTPILSNHEINFSGGNGSLPIPCNINDIPRVICKIHIAMEVNLSPGLKPLLFICKSKFD